MKKYLIGNFLRGTGLAALALLGAITAAAAADSHGVAVTAVAPTEPVGIVITDAASKVNPAEVAKYVKTLAPQVQAVMEKLSRVERAQVYLDAQTAFTREVATEQFTKSLEGKTPAQQAARKAALQSGVVSFLADAKYNYCNIMLEGEAEQAYDEKGVKKLAAAPHQCPTGVSMEKTLAYVNKLLACSIGDPAYTRVMPADEATDFRKQVDGTKTAFDGGGIGMILSVDPSRTIAATPADLAQFEAAKAKFLAKPPTSNGVDECTGKPIPLTAKDKAYTDEFWSKPPQAPYFSGIINHVMKGSPAEKAGIVDGDVIVKVDGQPVNDLEFNMVVEKMLRGPVGSTVKLTLKRDQTKEYVITREAILSDNVWSRDLGDGIYSIVVANFERNNTAFEIIDEMQKIGDKAKGFVFDVRNNNGGLVDEGVEAVTWLIHDGVIFSQRERVPGDPKHPQYLKITTTRVGSKDISETVDDTSHKLLERRVVGFDESDDVTGLPHRQFKEEQPFFGNKPMVVLVNGMCASACEIFAGGIGENHIAASKTNQTPWAPGVKDAQKAPQGAEIIGEQTYGKFIGQQLAPGPKGTSLKATIFRYFSPRGEWLGDAWKTKIGLTPDIKVVQPKTAVPYTDSDVQLNFAKQYLLSGGKAVLPAAPVAADVPVATKP
ncbi:MAG: S41 family peptidase [Candidatus Obscuribacterales bacterium]|nr:S41 family peptidase [Candidatus Obscuribacterales bacterium]